MVAKLKHSLFSNSKWRWLTLTIQKGDFTTKAPRYVAEFRALLCIRLELYKATLCRILGRITKKKDRSKWSLFEILQGFSVKKRPER